MLAVLLPRAPVIHLPDHGVDSFEYVSTRPVDFGQDFIGSRPGLNAFYRAVPSRPPPSVKSKKELSQSCHSVCTLISFRYSKERQSSYLPSEGFMLVII